MLENTLYRLKRAGSLTVAYFGGSISEGAGASAYENCWAAKTTRWLKERYPNCRIREVQASIGGTDSTLGVYRCDRDVCGENPDLVLFEFAVNDSGLDYTTALRNAEGCFRKIWQKNPVADIVTVYTTTKALSDRMAAGGVWHAKLAHAAVSEHYGAPQIDLGEALRCRVLTEAAPRDEAGGWLKYTTDSVHPNDAGHALCADVLRAHLEEMLLASGELSKPRAHVLPKPLTEEEQSHLRARVVDCTEAETDQSWFLKEQSLCRRYPHYLECTAPGGELSFRFKGRRIDLYWMMARDCGDALFSVDGGEEKRLSSWDSYCKRFNRANAACVAKGLPEGEHTLKLRLSGERAPESEGTALRIGAFLVL
ncbi:MAG: hypothetical protein IJM56_08790 [Clostridia bacterium]|nr:hypothetical protein [Clostridia bacterium]